MLACTVVNLYGEPLPQFVVIISTSLKKHGQVAQETAYLTRYLDVQVQYMVVANFLVIFGLSPLMHVRKVVMASERNVVGTGVIISENT